MELYTALYQSPLGLLTLTSGENALTGLYMQGQRFFPKGPLPAPTPDHPVLREAALWLDAYFSGKRPGLGELALLPHGTEYQQRVWQLLLQIPYGHTVTYGQLAKTLPSAQAVGGAVGRNPIAIIIPCHRVLGTGGKLTGYAGGLERKAWLLRHEGGTGL